PAVDIFKKGGFFPPPHGTPRKKGRKARKLPTPDARRRDLGSGRFADAKRGKASWSRRRFRHGCKGARYSPSCKRRIEARRIADRHCSVGVSLHEHRCSVPTP